MDQLSFVMAGLVPAMTKKRKAPAARPGLEFID
jgi:hypothetical protein